MTDSPAPETPHGISPARRAGTVRLNGRDVPRMGYGTMGLGHAVQKGTMSPEDATALLRRALDLGVQAYDTAQFYGDGTANQMLRAAFDGQRDDVCYVSKVGARVTRRGPIPLAAAQRPEELREQVELNLRSLGSDHIDVVHLRRMDRLPGLIAVQPSQRVPLDDQLAELVRLRDAGTIGAIGLSHVSLDQLRQALPAGITAVSNIHNVLHRDDEGVLQLAEQHDIVWAPWFPLGGARPGPNTKVAGNKVVQRIARDLDASPGQVGLAWLLARSPLSLVIAGTTSLDHLDENVAAAAIELPADAVEALDALG